MRMNYSSVVLPLSAALALGVTVASSARAESSPQQEPSSQANLPAEQVRIARATLNLENAFRDQFVAGKIDRGALSDSINEVIQATPEAARPKVQAHIDQIVQAGAREASEMTPEQRAAVATPPAPETIGRTQAAQFGAWGWPGAAGWGGYGAFAFPSTYAYGSGCGLGYGACGTGLGLGGWYW